MSNCRHGMWDAACPRCKPLHTSKDLLWNFRWEHTGPKGGHPVEIHSKRQFLRECTQRNLKWVGTDDLMDHGMPRHPKQNKHDLKKLVETHYGDIKQQAKAKARKEGMTWGR